MNILSKLFLISFLFLFYATPVFASDDDDYYRGNRSKFYGTVEQFPAGLNGVWVVDGRQIAVPAETRIKQEHGEVGIGAYVEVKGTYDGRDFQAHEIEVKQGARSASVNSPYQSAKKSEFYGTVTRIPIGGIGTWIIEDKEIYVDERTRIDEKHGQVAVGVPVEIKGTSQGKSFHAREIEVKNHR
jgi:hypothetical protein